MGILLWILFGLIARALAKAITPVDDPGGFIITIVGLSKLSSAGSSLFNSASARITVSGLFFWVCLPNAIMVFPALHHR